MTSPGSSGLTRATLTRVGPSVVCAACKTPTPLKNLRGQHDARVLRCIGCGEVVLERRS
jgi:hypothetical protein